MRDLLSIAVVLAILLLSTSSETSATTTICYSETGTATPDRSNETPPTWFITAQVCGTPGPSGTFNSVTHTFVSGVSCPECWEPDWLVESVEYRFYGLKNITEQRYYVPEVIHHPSSGYGLPQASYTDNSGQVDFALTYAKITIFDFCPNENNCKPGDRYTATARAFVGFRESFEVDWADSNNNGIVDQADSDSLQSVYDQPDAYWDFNMNGIVDIVDASLFAIHFDKQWPLQPYPGQSAPSQNLSVKTLQTPIWQSSCPTLPGPHRAYLGCA